MHELPSTTDSVESATEMMRAIVTFQMEFMALLFRGVVHNFAGPIAAINGYAQLLEMKYPQLAKELSVVARASHKMEDLLADLSNRADLFVKESPRNVDINKLVSFELCFLEADPVFKHHRSRRTLLDSNLPMVKLRPRNFALGFSLLMQTILGRIRLQDESSLEIHTYQHDSKIWLKIELISKDLKRSTEKVRQQVQSGSGDRLNVSEPMLRTLQEIALIVFRQMGLDSQSETVEGRETVLIEIT